MFAALPIIYNGFFQKTKFLLFIFIWYVPIFMHLLKEIVTILIY